MSAHRAGDRAAAAPVRFAGREKPSPGRCPPGDRLLPRLPALPLGVRVRGFRGVAERPPPRQTRVGTVLGRPLSPAAVGAAAQRSAPRLRAGGSPAAPRSRFPHRRRPRRGLGVSGEGSSGPRFLLLFKPHETSERRSPPVLSCARSGVCSRLLELASVAAVSCPACLASDTANCRV